MQEWAGVSRRWRCAGWARVCIPLRGNAVHILLISQNGLELFNQILQFWSKFQQKDFEIPIFKNSNICACAHCNHLCLRIIYKFLVAIWISNLHWEYILISEVGQWFYQLDHVTLSKNVFWSVNCTLFYIQIYSVKMSSLYLVERLAFLARSCTLESISRKSHLTTFMTLPIDAIYQGLSSM